MTRINVVPPQEMTREHLLGEWKEITRPITKVRKVYLATDREPPYLEGDYRLNKGHEVWFYYRLGFIQERYDALYNEGIRRGYKMNKIEGLFDGIPDKYMGGYTPTANALAINRARIQERLQTN